MARKQACMLTNLVGKEVQKNAETDLINLLQDSYKQSG